MRLLIAIMALTLSLHATTVRAQEPLCEADWDGDGGLGFFDLVGFLTDHANLDPRADLTDDDEVTFWDLFAYLDLYVACYESNLPPTPPNPPLDLRIILEFGTTFVFQWDPPAEEEVDGYVLRYGLESGDPSVIAKETPEEYAIVDLAGDVPAYYLSVYAVQDGLESIASNEIVVVVPNFVPPDPVTDADAQLSAGGDPRMADVWWTDPTTDDLSHIEIWVDFELRRSIPAGMEQAQVMVGTFDTEHTIDIVAVDDAANQSDRVSVSLTTGPAPAQPELAVNNVYLDATIPPLAQGDPGLGTPEEPLVAPSGLEHWMTWPGLTRVHLAGEIERAVALFSGSNLESEIEVVAWSASDPGRADPQLRATDRADSAWSPVEDLPGVYRATFTDGKIITCLLTDPSLDNMLPLLGVKTMDPERFENVAYEGAPDLRLPEPPADLVVAWFEEYSTVPDSTQQRVEAMAELPHAAWFQDETLDTIYYKTASGNPPGSPGEPEPYFAVERDNSDLLEVGSWNKAWLSSTVTGVDLSWFVGLGNNTRPMQFHPGNNATVSDCTFLFAVRDDSIAVVNGQLPGDVTVQDCTFVGVGKDGGSFVAAGAIYNNIVLQRNVMHALYDLNDTSGGPAKLIGQTTIHGVLGSVHASSVQTQLVRDSVAFGYKEPVWPGLAQPGPTSRPTDVWDADTYASRIENVYVDGVGAIKGEHTAVVRSHIRVNGPIVNRKKTMLFESCVIEMVGDPFELLRIDDKTEVILRNCLIILPDRATMLGAVWADQGGGTIRLERNIWWSPGEIKLATGDKPFTVLGPGDSTQLQEWIAADVRNYSMPGDWSADSPEDVRAVYGDGVIFQTFDIPQSALDQKTAKAIHEALPASVRGASPGPNPPPALGGNGATTAGYGPFIFEPGTE